MTSSSKLLFGIIVVIFAATITGEYGWAVNGNQAIAQTAAALDIYYEKPIQGIVRRNCGRCHSGQLRNLLSYDKLKAYIDSGLLRAMISPGGPMNRFAGPDADTILTWIARGAPEKPAAQVVAGTIPGFGPQLFAVDVPPEQITYDNTIKFILAKHCLECHSGRFRNLTTYDNIKFYADSGLLQTLVSRGGPMNRFAGPNSKTIIAWINNGAPK